MTHQFKLPNPIWLLLALIAIFLLASCGTANKNRSSLSQVVDSTATEVHHESTELSTDTAHKETNDLSYKTKVEEGEGSSVKIEFHPGDSAIGPVVIRKDSSGATVIDPGGRSIKSVTDTHKKSRTETIDTRSKASDSAGIRRVSKTQVSDSGRVEVHREVVSKSVAVRRWQLPWYAWLIIPVLGFIVWRFRLYRRGPAKTGLPYYSPKDNQV